MKNNFIEPLSDAHLEKLRKYNSALQRIIDAEQEIKDLGFEFELEIKNK